MRDQVPTKFNGVMLIGEAPGNDEIKEGLPFVGASGKELNWFLELAGVAREECYVTNVFLAQPLYNDVSRFFTGTGVSRKAIPERQADLDRLPVLIQTVVPRVIIAFGNTPTWALLRLDKISKCRGYVTNERISGLNVPVMPTWHPAAVLRQYNMHPQLVADVQKANEWVAEDPFVIDVARTWDDIYTLSRDIMYNAKVLAVDIETKQRQCTMISFAYREGHAYVIPIRDDNGKSAWSHEDESRVWGIIRGILQCPIPKINQNILYDTQFLWRAHGIEIRNIIGDTMILHHCLYSELPKDLGTLGSLHTNLPRWKHLRAADERE